MVTPRPAPRKSLADRGAAAVEFALVLPLFLVLVFGIVEFGRGYHTKTTLTHAAREGARVAALNIGDPVQAARQAAPSLNQGLLQVSVSASPCTVGQPVSVTVTYPVVYNVPFVNDGTWTISETGTMRCGG